MAALLDQVVLPASPGLGFTDACSGQPILDGLCCRLIRRDGRLLGLASQTPSGVHHWPTLPAQWRDAAAPPQADVIVEDRQQRFLPLSLPWPFPAGLPSSVHGGVRLLRLSLNSAPQRPLPPGMASISALLVWQANARPAAWVRVSASDALGRVFVGSSDAEGRLALNLPMPRPQRPGADAPVSLRFFYTATSLPPTVPDLPAWLLQSEVRALARVDAPASALDSFRITAGHSATPVTEGLDEPRRSELRLVPL